MGDPVAWQLAEVAWRSNTAKAKALAPATIAKDPDSAVRVLGAAPAREAADGAIKGETAGGGGSWFYDRQQVAFACLAGASGGAN
ncbi:hypothetical protein NKH73_25250 [Mesorhizobium sp. M0938]|uniref:hypothetical protein n=1 Tax=unclassified Mesorhizobium TaxID=325217 RepID=UPI00333D3CBB